MTEKDKIALYWRSAKIIFFPDPRNTKMMLGLLEPIHNFGTDLGGHYFWAKIMEIFVNFN